MRSGSWPSGAVQQRSGQAASGGAPSGKAVEGCGLLRREGECRVDGVQDAELFQARERALRLGLIEGALQLVADAGAADPVEVREVAAEQVEGALFQPEAEARLVADGAEDARGVVLEALVVDHAHEAGAQVRLAAGGIEQLARRGAVQLQRHRVDRDVAAEEVVVDRRRADLWQCAGAGVRLGAGGGEVEERTTPSSRQASPCRKRSSWRVSRRLPKRPRGRARRRRLRWRCRRPAMRGRATDRERFRRRGTRERRGCWLFQRRRRGGRGRRPGVGRTAYRLVWRDRA